MILESGSVSKTPRLRSGGQKRVVAGAEGIERPLAALGKKVEAPAQVTGHMQVAVSCKNHYCVTSAEVTQ